MCGSFNGKMQIDKGQVLIILSSVFIFVDRQKGGGRKGKSIIFKLIPTFNICIDFERFYHSNLKLKKTY